MDRVYTRMESRKPSRSMRKPLAGVAVFATLCGVAWQTRSVSRPGVMLAGRDVVGGPGSPLAKRVVVGMDTNINMHAAWDDWDAWSAEMKPFWTDDMVYDFAYVGRWNFGPTKGLRQWFDGEHMHYNRAIPDCQFTDFIRAATNSTCTSASYGLGRWSADLAGVPPPASKPWIRVRDLDFYLLQGDRIKVNWCLVDLVDIFQQVGYQVLPPAPMSTDGFGYLPPHASDGLPAPLSAMVDADDTEESERIWRAALQEDYLNASGTASQWEDAMVWYGPAGIGTATSRVAYVRHFLVPLHAAFSSLDMQLDMVVCEGAYCGAHFYVFGDHTGTWLGEAATGKRISIRCGAHARIQGKRIVEGWLIIDLPRAFRDMGVDLFARAKAQAA